MIQFFTFFSFHSQCYEAITKLQNICCEEYNICFCFDIHDYIECLTTVTFPTCFINGNEQDCCFCFRTFSSGLRVPKGIGRLQELQVLGKVDIKRSSEKALEELGELITQLKKLFHAVAGTPKQEILSMVLGKLSSLFFTSAF